MSGSDSLHAAYVAYFVVAALSIFGSIVVCICLFRFSEFNSVFSYLILYLHLSLVFEEVFTLPFIFKKNDSLCAAAEAFHFYFALMNVGIMFELIVCHYLSIFEDKFGIKKLITLHGWKSILIFPMITFLPFSTGDYFHSSGPFCILPYGEGRLWGIFVYYSFAWAFLILSILITIRIYVKIFLNDRALAQKFLSTIGLYSMVALLCWVPRYIERSIHIDGRDTPESALLVSFFPVYICGILLSLIFFSEKKSLELFEMYNTGGGGGGDASRSTFTWEQADLLDILDSVDTRSSLSLRPSRLTTLGTKIFGGRLPSNTHPTVSMDNPILKSLEMPSPSFSSNSISQGIKKKRANTLDDDFDL